MEYWRVARVGVAGERSEMRSFQPVEFYTATIRNSKSKILPTLSV